MPLTKPNFFKPALLSQFLMTILFNNLCNLRTFNPVSCSHNMPRSDILCYPIVRLYCRCYRHLREKRISRPRMTIIYYLWLFSRSSLSMRGTALATNKAHIISEFQVHLGLDPCQRVSRTMHDLILWHRIRSVGIGFLFPLQCAVAVVLSSYFGSIKVSYSKCSSCAY